MPTKQAATISGVKAMGLQLKGAAPAFSKKCITKGELNQWYYVDNVAAGISAYPDSRVLCYEDLVNAGYKTPAAQFYQYDVTRSGIPNANGGYFTYTSTDFTTQTILQNSYGYVGRFCMQEGSFSNNQSNLYTISQVGVCYPSYGAYPQPYLVGCCLHFNNLGSYTVEDVKIYQLIDVENAKLNAITVLGSTSVVTDMTLAALGAIPGVNIVWGAVSLLTIAGGYIYGLGSHMSNQLRYVGSGAYTNGSVCLDTVGASNGTPQYYIAFKVKNPQGFYPITFGYGQYESAPPGLSSSCGGSGNTAATWTLTGTTSCVSCTATNVYRDTNQYSATAGKYRVGATGSVVNNDPTSACDTAVNYSTLWGYTYSCSNGTVSSTAVYKNSNPCFSGNQYQIGSTTYASDPSQSAPSTTQTWVVAFGQYECSGCDQYFVEIQNNPCATGYGTTRRGSLRYSNTTNCGGCCGQSTTQVWTDTGATRCNSCVNEKEQQQTNACATGYNTTRWVAGGSACDYAANYSIADGTVYTCSNGVVTANTIYKNSNGCFTGNQWSLLGTTYASRPTPNSYPDTTQNWQPNGDRYCSGLDQYEPQIQSNPCAINYGGTRDYLIEPNSASCAEVYVITPCTGSGNGFSIVYPIGTFSVGQRVTVSGVTYVISSITSPGNAGSNILSSTGAVGCPSYTQFYSYCTGQYYWIGGSGYGPLGNVDGDVCVTNFGSTTTPQGSQVFNWTEVAGCECV